MPEEELTPEEKLLKVIQKGDNQEPESTDAVDNSADDSEGKATTVVAQATGTDPVAKSGGESSDDTFASAEHSSAVAVSAVAVASTGKSPLRVLNRAMVAVAAVLLCISGVEMLANIRSPFPAITQEPFETTSESVASENFIADLSETLDMYSKKRIFGKPDPVLITQVVDQTPVLAGWRAYARKNYDLMGLSMVMKQADDGSEYKIREAIVVDKKTGKMHFLSTGQTIVIEKQTVKIDEITDDNVTFSKGDEEVTLD